MIFFIILYFMKQYTLKDLRQDAENRKQKHKDTLKTRYALARSLGFTSQESVVLQNRSERIIRELAQEKEDNA